MRQSRPSVTSRSLSSRSSPPAPKRGSLPPLPSFQKSLQRNPHSPASTTNTFTSEALGWGESSEGSSTCSESMRTWVWIPKQCESQAWPHRLWISTVSWNNEWRQEEHFHVLASWVSSRVGEETLFKGSQVESERDTGILLWPSHSCTYECTHMHNPRIHYQQVWVERGEEREEEKKEEAREKKMKKDTNLTKQRLERKQMVVQKNKAVGQPLWFI